MSRVVAKARNNDPTLPFNERKMSFESGAGFAVDIRVRGLQGNAAERYAEGAIIGFWESEEDANRVAQEVNNGERYRPGHQFHGRAYGAIVIPAWNIPADPPVMMPWETPKGSAAMLDAYERAGVPLPQWLRAILVPRSGFESDAKVATGEDDIALTAAFDGEVLLDALYAIQPELHDGKPSPYQFLLLLYAIAGARRGFARLRPYRDAREGLADLLTPFKLAGSEPNPANPWYALRKSAWWEIEQPIPKSYKQISDLNTVAGLTLEVYDAVRRDAGFAADAVRAISLFIGDDPNVKDAVVLLGLSQISSEKPRAGELPRLVPAEIHSAERFTIECKALGAEDRERREAKLQTAYKGHLVDKGHRVSSRYQIPIDGQYLYTDLHDETTNELIEVKASSDRVTMRLALGQILDYKRLIAPASCAVVVPSPPSQGIVDLFGDYRIRIAWPNGAGGFDEVNCHAVW